MIALAFDVRGKLAHFRRPDTTATHMTYPFITPTAARGLVGAILGIEDFTTDDKIGIQLLNPVISVAQQMSMLGKDGGGTFNRPTTIELLINPAYRIFYVGNEFGEQLLHFLRKDSAVYPTYLGSAFAITKPVFINSYTRITNISDPAAHLNTKTVIPTSIIKDIEFESDRDYSRAGGFMLKYKGNRTFEKSVDFIYERSGKSIAFELASDKLSPDIQVVQLEEDIVCLS